MSLGLVVLAAFLTGARTMSMPPQVPQAPASDTAARRARAAATITGADLAAYHTALLADSMRGRTPSAAVERAAAYVAAQLRALGLSVPATTDRSTGPALGRNRYAGGLHWYPVPGQLHVDYQHSLLELSTRLHGTATALVTETGEPPDGRSTRMPLAGMARVLDTAVAPRQISSFFDFLPADAGVLIAGPHTPASLRAVDVRRRTVVYVPPPGQDTAAQAALIRDLAARSGGVVVSSAADSTVFAARQGAAEAHPPALLPFVPPQGEGWAVEVWSGALDEVLRLNGIDVAALRTAPAPVVRPLPSMIANMNWAAAPTADTAMAPNVVAVVPGSDASLQNALSGREYVVIEASLDGEPHGGPETSLSVAGLLALAKAFTQPGAQPRRSLVFLATSGGVGQWGRRYFLSSGPGSTLPALALTLDLRRPLTDSVLYVDGGQEVKVESAPAWVGAFHPELGVTVVDTGSVIATEADASAFTDRWLPTLVLRAGGDATAPRRGPPPASAGIGDTAVVARVLQLMFYTIHALANTARPPLCTAAARQRLPTSLP